MSEEINLTTDDAMEDYDQEIIMDEIETEDLEDSVKTEETVEVIEVEPIEEINIELDEAIGWVGGDSTRHYSLYGRDEPNQHPITAITGLREELNDIEALDVVYSNEKNHADYYLWEDENILQENRIGYFVSACSDINKIKKCTVDDDILGVTVDSAGFIGAQDDVARDIKYGLVVTTGVVHVRCESSVNVGDYVVSNDYGYAKSNKDGYKVVGRHQIDGVEYAEIVLATPINRICKLSDDVENVNTRMEDAEKNIVSAINVANAAYNKAVECNNVSEYAIKNALKALNKSNDIFERTDGIVSNVSSINEVAVQARAIAESAAVSAETIRKEAMDAANDANKNVNDLIKDLEPITTWKDPESGNVGAEYFTTYIKEGLATKVEVETVENLTEDNKIAIEKNAEGIQTVISSIDKYSVGEYSQSYGLTHEQAKSILKAGMIYIPTKHSNTRSHSEIFEDTGEENEFTPYNCYEWDGNDWIEVLGAVAFFSEVPEPTGDLKYWYIDSDDAPNGYEPYTLYVYKDNKWVKVNIFYNNPNNRMASSISHEVDKISLEITNARGSYVGLNARLTNTESNLETVASWTKDPDGNQYNLATIKQTADTAGSSIAQIAASIGNYTTIEGAWDEVGKDTNLTYYTTEDKMYWYYKDGRWNSTDNAADAGLVINAASIITAINNDTSEIALNANRISFNGPVTANNNFAITKDGDNVLYLDTSGNIRMAGYIMPPEQSDEEEVYIGVGKPITTTADGLAVYSTNYVNRFPNDGILNDDIILDDTNSHLAPFLSIFQDNSFNADSDKYYTNILSTQDIMFTVAPLENSLEDSEATAYSQTPLILTFDGGVMSGEWDFDQDQFFTKLIGSNTGFVIQKDGTRYGSFYFTGSNALCLKSDQGSDLCLNIAGSTYLKCSASSGGSLYGTWRINNYNAHSGSEIVSGDTHLGRFEYHTTYDCQAIYFAKPISFFSGTYQGSDSWTISYYNNGSSKYGVFAVCNGGGYLNGTWKLNNSTLTTSDKNKKNSIESFDERYNTLFDNLSPIRYKYNDGTSDRYHTGFIAQDVERAIANSNLDTLDFAGYVKDEEGVCYLRYEEFISLNTQQIQKAKKRIAELENKVAELEALIKGE